MMRKSLVLLVAILVIVSLVVGGCASQPAAAVPPQTTATAPATSAAPTTSAVPKTTAPATSAAPAQVMEMRFSHNNPPQGWVTVQFLIPWAKKLEAATNGAIKVVWYHAQTLAATADNYDATATNLAQLGWMASSPYQGRFPLSEVISLPFMMLPSGTVNGKKMGQAAINSHIIQELYETVPEIQKEWAQTKLMFLHTSDSFFLVSKKPIKNINDMKGLKIAVLSGGPAVDMWKKLGASPLYLPAPSVYESGQKGVLDAAAVGWSNLGTFRFYEVFPYATDMTSFVTLFILTMNLETWNKLSPEVQKQVMSVSGIAGAEFAGDTAWRLEARDDVLNQIKASGSKFEVLSLEPGEQDKLKTLAGKPVWDEWVASMKAKGLAADKVLDAALKLTEKYK
jgi:TRAP-type C4-dicarboxylate transport system substrate-binding protein